MLHVVVSGVIIIDAVHGGFALVRADGLGIGPELGSQLVCILDLLVRRVDGGEDEVGGVVVVDERVLLRTVADLEDGGRLFVAVWGIVRIAGIIVIILYEQLRAPRNEALLITIEGGKSHIHRFVLGAIFSQFFSFFLSCSGSGESLLIDSGSFGEEVVGGCWLLSRWG